MSEETFPRAVPPPPLPPPVAPPTPGFQVMVGGNQNSKIIIAAGSIAMKDKPQLPVAHIQQAELDVVQRAWVDLDVHDEHVRTTEKAVARLTGEGTRLAVVRGPP